MRRAVIIVNILLLLCRSLIMMGINQLSTLVNDFSDFSRVSSESFREIDDGSTNEVVLVDLVQWGLFGATLAVSLGILCAGVSIYGAITFNKYLVAANAIFVLFNMPPWDLISMSIVYPHAFLIYYLNTGIISEENYFTEEQSCCFD